MLTSVRVPAGAGREQRSGGGAAEPERTGRNAERTRQGGVPLRRRPLAAPAAFRAASPPAAERAAPAGGLRSPGRTRLGGSLSPLARPVLAAAGGEDAEGARVPSLSPPSPPAAAALSSLEGATERTDACEREGESHREERGVQAGGRPRGTGQSRPAAGASGGNGGERPGCASPSRGRRESAVAAPREARRERKPKRRKLRSGPGSLPAAAREDRKSVV